MRLNTKVDAGELKFFVEICTRGEAINGKGFNELVYTSVLKTRCKVKTIRAKEILTDGTSNNKIAFSLIVRRRRDFEITNEHFAFFRNKYFNIYHVDEMDEFFDEIVLREIEV